MLPPPPPAARWFDTRSASDSASRSPPSEDETASEAGVEQLCCPRAPPPAHSRLLVETAVHSDQGLIHGRTSCRGRFLFRAAHCGCRTGTCATARSDGGGHASEDRRRRPLWPVPPRTSGARIVDGACDAYPRTSARAAAVKQAGSRWPPPRTRPASGVPRPEVPSCQFPGYLSTRSEDPF